MIPKEAVSRLHVGKMDKIILKKLWTETKWNICDMLQVKADCTTSFICFFFYFFYFICFKGDKGYIYIFKYLQHLDLCSFDLLFITFDKTLFTLQMQNRSIFS